MNLEDVFHQTTYYQKLVKKFEIGDIVKSRTGLLGKVVDKSSGCGYLHVKFFKFDRPFATIPVESCEKVEE